MSSTDLQKLVLASLLAALTAVGAFVAIPIGPVPIVLQKQASLPAPILTSPEWEVEGVIR
mgnify:CR=1 FL=1